MNKLSNNPLARVGLVGASIILSAYLYTRNYRLGRRCKCTKQYYTEDVVIVTGSDSGIGLETAFLVAKRGARVILANADKEASWLAKVQILSRLSPKSADIVALECDFASFRSVRKFVHDVLQYLRDRPGCRITALVNAEEFYPTKRELTVDGFEKTFQINYLSPFLLIVLLLPTMSKNKDRRVVCLSSSVIDSCRELHLEELNHYVGVPNTHLVFQTNRAYQISKLCLALYISNLCGLEVKKHSYCVDPGIVESEISYKSQPPQKIKRSCVKTVNEGCQGILHALLSYPTHLFYIKGMDYVDKYLSPLFLEEIPKNMLYNKTCEWTNALDRIIIVDNGILPSIAIGTVGPNVKKSIEDPLPKSSPRKKFSLNCTIATEPSMSTSTPIKVDRLAIKNHYNMLAFIQAINSTDKRTTKNPYCKHLTMPETDKSLTTQTKDVASKSVTFKYDYKPHYIPNTSGTDKPTKDSNIPEPTKSTSTSTETGKDKSSTMIYPDKEPSISQSNTSTDNSSTEEPDVKHLTAPESDKLATNPTKDVASKSVTFKYYYKPNYIPNTSGLTNKPAEDSPIPETTKSTSTETGKDKSSTMIYPDKEPSISEVKHVTVPESDKLPTTPTKDIASKSATFKYYYKPHYIPNTSGTDKPTKDSNIPEPTKSTSTSVETAKDKSSTMVYPDKEPSISEVKHVTVPESDKLATNPTKDVASKSVTFKYYYKPNYIPNTSGLTNKPAEDSNIPEPTKSTSTSTETGKDKSSTMIYPDKEPSISQSNTSTDNSSTEEPDVKHLTAPESDKLATNPTKDVASKSTTFKYYYKPNYIPNTSGLTDKPAEDSPIPETTKSISTSTETGKDKSSTMIYPDKEPSISQSNTSTDNSSTEEPDVKHPTAPESDKLPTHPTKDIASKSATFKYYYKPHYIPNTSGTDKPTKDSNIPEPTKSTSTSVETAKDKSSTMVYPDKEPSISEVKHVTVPESDKLATNPTKDVASKSVTFKYYYKPNYIPNTSGLTNKPAEDSNIPEPTKSTSTSTETGKDKSSTMIYPDKEPSISQSNTSTDNSSTEEPDVKHLTAPESDKLATNPTKDVASKSTTFKYYYKPNYIPNTSGLTDKPAEDSPIPETTKSISTSTETGKDKSSTMIYPDKEPSISQSNTSTDNSSTEEPDVKHPTAPESDKLPTHPTKDVASKSATFKYYYKPHYIPNTSELTDKPAEDSPIPDPTKSISTSTETGKDKSSTMIYSDKEPSISKVKHVTVSESDKLPTTPTKDIASKSATFKYYYKPHYIPNTSELTDKPAEDSPIPETTKSTSTETGKDKSSTMIYPDKEPSISQSNTSTDNSSTEEPDVKHPTAPESDKLPTHPTKDVASKSATFKYYYKPHYIPNTSELTDKPAEDSPIPDPTKSISTSTETGTDKSNTMIYPDKEPSISQSNTSTDNSSTEEPDVKHLTAPESDKLPTNATKDVASKSVTFKYYYKPHHIPNTSGLTDKPAEDSPILEPTKSISTSTEIGKDKSSTMIYSDKEPSISEVKHVTVPESDKLPTTPTKDIASKSATFKYYYKSHYIPNTSGLTDKPTNDSDIPEPTKSISTSVETRKDKSNTMIYSDKEPSISESNTPTDNSSIEDPDLKHITAPESDELATNPTKDVANKSATFKYYYKPHYIPNTSTLTDKPVAKHSSIPEPLLCGNQTEDAVTEESSGEDTSVNPSVNKNIDANVYTTPEAGIHDNLASVESVEKGAADPSADVNLGPEDLAVPDHTLYNNVAYTENDVPQFAAAAANKSVSEGSAIEDSDIEFSAAEDSAIEKSETEESAGEDSDTDHAPTESPVENHPAVATPDDEDHTTMTASICNNIVNVEHDVAEDADAEATCTDDPASEDSAADTSTDANNSAPQTLFEHL